MSYKIKDTTRLPIIKVEIIGVFSNLIVKERSFELSTFDF